MCSGLLCKYHLMPASWNTPPLKFGETWANIKAAYHNKVPWSLEPDLPEEANVLWQTINKSASVPIPKQCAEGGILTDKDLTIKNAA